MMNPNSDGRLLTSDDDVRALWLRLLDPSASRRRSLWMIFVGDNDQPSPKLFPIDDIPVEPDRRLAAGLASIVSQIVEDGTAASVLLALSRPGKDAVSAGDRAWAALLREQVGGWLASRPVMLCTAAGIEPIDEAGPSPRMPSRTRYAQGRPSASHPHRSVRSGRRTARRR